MIRNASIVTFALVLVGAACGGDDDAQPAADAPLADAPVIDPGDGGEYAPELDPADFVAEVDNPYYPLPAGGRWEYDSKGGDEVEHTEVVVTDQKKEVLGIPVTVVRDTVSVNGEVLEDTYDWFAQDKDGNVWYLGEDSKEYDENGDVDTSGSWEAGVDGAYAGIVMPAEPTVGHAYRQEYYPGEAEDLGEIIKLDQTESLPAGEYSDVVVTRDWNPLEPETIEEKSYAPGVGMVAERNADNDEIVELIETTLGS